MSKTVPPSSLGGCSKAVLIMYTIKAAKFLAWLCHHFTGGIKESQGYAPAQPDKQEAQRFHLGPAAHQPGEGQSRPAQTLGPETQPGMANAICSAEHIR